jgi:Arc/MetJ family transcription regulator
MRTTIQLSDELFRQAKRRAADEGTTLRAVVEAALRGYLSGRRTRVEYRLLWRTERGRVLPGVHLDDRDSLFDAMDGRR